MPQFARRPILWGDVIFPKDADLVVVEPRHYAGPVANLAIEPQALLVVGARHGTTVTLDSSTITVVYQGPLPLLHSAGAPVATLDVHNRPPGVYSLRPTITLPGGLTLAALTPPRLRVAITAAP